MRAVMNSCFLRVRFFLQIQWLESNQDRWGWVRGPALCTGQAWWLGALGASGRREQRQVRWEHMGEGEAGYGAMEDTHQAEAGGCCWADI